MTQLANYVHKQDFFGFGYQFGRLQGDLVFLMEQLEAQEKEQMKEPKGWKYTPPKDFDEDEDEELEDNESRLVQELRRDIEESCQGKMKLISECSEKDYQLKGLRTLLMDFQDLFIQLLAHKRINELDVPEVINLLRRSGIHDSDLRVRAGQEVK